MNIVQEREWISNRIHVVLNTPTTEHDDVQKYSIVFIKDTAAYKCYGCKETIIKDGRSPHPPPFDILVTTKTFRHYREKSKDGKPGPQPCKHSQLNFPLIDFTG